MLLKEEPKDGVTPGGDDNTERELLSKSSGKKKGTDKRASTIQ
jgi:hypothetical protein